MMERRTLSGVPVEMRPTLRHLIEKLESDRSAYCSTCYGPSSDLQIEAAQMLLGLEQMLMLAKHEHEAEIADLRFRLEKAELWASCCTQAVKNLREGKPVGDFEE